MSGRRKQKGLPVGPNDLVAQAVLWCRLACLSATLINKPHLHHSIPSTYPDYCHCVYNMGE